MPGLIIAIAVVVDDRNRYLLIRRARDPFKGYWSFISGIGASRKGLSPDQAVVDEVNHDISADFSGELAFSYRINNSELANRVHVYIGSVDPRRISLNPKAATEYKWFSSVELNEIDLAFEDRWVLERIQYLL